MGRIQLRDYQKPAVESLVDNDSHALFSDVGSGKTVMVLEALDRLDDLGRVFIVAPLRVMYNVWPKEIEKFTDFSYTIAHGSVSERDKAISSQSDIVLINPEGLTWLFENWDLPENSHLIIDESHKFKSPSSKRFKLLKQNLSQFKRRWIMTATPATRNCLDLWSQLFIVDKGETLGKNITYFRNKYAYKGGYLGREWRPRSDANQNITQATKKIVHRVEVQIEDNTLHDFIYVDMPPDAKSIYKKAERQLAIEVENEPDKITEAAISAYSLSRQIANGSFYSELKNVIRVHNAKAEATRELFDSIQGNSLLVFFLFKHDKISLLEKFPSAEVIDGTTPAKNTPEIIKRFSLGLSNVILCHPQSAGTGLDGLQTNCSNICWYGLPDDLGLFLQGNGRIAGHRANGRLTTISRIIAKGTIDEVISDRLDHKDIDQKSILNHYRR